MDHDAQTGQMCEACEFGGHSTVDSQAVLERQGVDLRDAVAENIKTGRRHSAVDQFEDSEVDTLLSNEAHVSTDQPASGIHGTYQVGVVIKDDMVGVVELGRKGALLPNERFAYN